MQNGTNNTEQFNTLVNNPVFIKECMEVLKKSGVTAEEWNEDTDLLIEVLAILFLKKTNKGGLTAH
jgi:hypothetical protein